MKLNVTQSIQLVEKLNSLWGGRPCGPCGSFGWNVSNYVFQLTEFDPVSTIIGGARAPFGLAICKNCGDTRLVNLIEIGLMNAETGEWIDA